MSHMPRHSGRYGRPLEPDVSSEVDDDGSTRSRCGGSPMGHRRREVGLASCAGDSQAIPLASARSVLAHRVAPGSEPLRKPLDAQWARNAVNA